MENLSVELEQEKDYQLRPVSYTDVIELKPSKPVPKEEESEFMQLLNYKPFIEANTMSIDLHELKNHCIIPVFSKDNENTIPHQHFLETALESVSAVFPGYKISDPDIRVSHEIKGRIPEAIHKQVKELLEQDKTRFFERFSYIINLPEIVDTISGNELSLTIGGVRSYNQENLYNKKTYEKFKFFIGFQVKVCCNLCVSTDGYLEEMKAMSTRDLKLKMIEVMQNYNAEKHLKSLKQLPEHSLTEHQFAQLIGKSRLYQHLPKAEKELIPALYFTDGHINTIAKDYYGDTSFSRENNGDISLWKLYNLFTSANKSSYIDTFLGRNANAHDFIQGIQKTLDGSSKYHWFLG
ncbi:MAG: DUF3871 family protein [Saprospiraceae bacterium]|nr:DUF3871 family protein [Saprospiraceae bacterium]